MNKRAIIAILTGALTTLAFAPFNFFAFAIISPAVLFLVIQRQSIKSASRLGWLYGLGFFGSGVSWVYVSIHTYGYTHPLLAAALTFIFCAALALLFLGQIYLYQKYFSHRFKLLSFAVIWLLFEWLRSWLFTGFPWLYLGYSTIDTPLSAYASIGGVWLNSALVITISMSLVAVIEQANKTRIALVCLFISALIGTSLVIPDRWTKVSADKVDITIIQPNIAQETKWQRSELVNIVDKYYRMTEPELGNNIIIWPETAIPSLYSTVQDFFRPLVDQQRDLNGSLITGVPMQVADPKHPDGYRIHNSILNLTQGSFYHKQRLVPFGEYVPFQEEFRDLFNFLNIPEMTFSRPTQQHQSLLSANDIRYSTAICYEIAYPELVREYSQHADLLLTLSNDTWFSHSIGPDQHFQIARMRAVENGRWLIRAANNGISAIVNPQGEVVNIAPRYTEAVLKGQVQPLQGLTPYQIIGVWPLIILYLIMLAISLLANISHKRRVGNNH